MAQYQHAWTRRIAQLTGDYDPEGRPHFNTTGPWGVDGVDLGANTEHAGRVFIFFGDVPLTQPNQSWPPHDADLIAFIDTIDIPPGASVAAAKQLDHQLDVFFVGSDGGLYVAWVIDGGIWQGPVRITPPNVAPPGAGIATARQRDNQLDVFFIGNDGSLNVVWVVDGGIWQGPVGVPPAHLAPPGADIAAAKQRDNQLDVFVIGDDGSLFVYWVIDGGIWEGPVGIPPSQLAPPGASVAAAKQRDNQLDVFVIGHDGSLFVYWVIDGGIWQGPVGIPPARLAPAGANLAAAKQLDNQLDVFVIGNDGSLFVYWVIDGGTWQGPVGIPPHHLAPQDAHVAAAKQLDNQLDVFVIGNDRGLDVFWVIDGGIWQGPVKTIPAPFRLTPILKDDRFFPFSVKTSGKTWMPLTSETPTGAFSYGGRAYVFIVTGDDGIPVSSLTSTSDPFQPQPYRFHFELSNATAPGGGWFLQVAPWVIKNEELGGLPLAEGDGLIMFGHGGGRAEDQRQPGVQLAWMPLHAHEDLRRSDVRFYTGDAADLWSPHESRAKTLFTTRFGWTSLSAGRLPGTGRWIVLNQKAGSIQDNQAHDTWNEPIVARIASTPWDIASAVEIPIFDPVRDGARGKYMASPATPPSPMWPPAVHPSFAYGAYLLNPHSTWNADERAATITYLLSTGSPYQVQVMESRILFVEE